MSTELATRQDGAVQAPAQQVSESAAIIQVIERAAMNPDVDIDKMERLLQMQERVMERQAAMEYSAAMAAMQTEMPSIAERGKTNNGKYATLEDIVDTVRPVMQKHGFAVSFRVKTADKGIEVTGVLMHKGGHREETAMLLPADTSGNKNAVQAFGSTTSYGKRYVLCALLNITTRDEDDDGVSAAPTKFVTSFQEGQIRHLASRCPADTQQWLETTYGEPGRVPKAEFNSLCAHLKKIIQEASSGNSAEASAGD